LHRKGTIFLTTNSEASSPTVPSNTPQKDASVPKNLGTKTKRSSCVGLKPNYFHIDT
jgi:hypothetical protein